MHDRLIIQATCAVVVNGKLRGTAWLISNRGQLLTAGHVLGTSNPISTVQVRFSGNIHTLTAHKIVWKYDQERGVDFAVLQLEEELEGRRPLEIQLPDFVPGKFRLYGYGKTLVKMSSGRGDFLGIYDCGGYPLFKLDSKQIGEGGYSGSAVISDDLQAVVAIHIQATIRATGAERDTVLAMPLYRIPEHWDGVYKIVMSRDLPFSFDPYLFDLFVNRKKEARYLTDILSKKKSETCFFEYTGSSGIGKTWLLKYLLYLSVIKQEKCLIGYVDLKLDRLSRSPQNVYPILEEIAVALSSKRENRYLFDIFNEELEVYKEQKRRESERYLFESFKKCLNDLPLSYNVVICFDNIEYADQAAIQELEDQLLEPLHRDQENFIFVFAGHEEQYWGNKKIRRCIQKSQLNRLDENDIKELVECFLCCNRKVNIEHKEAVAKMIYQLTLGHPLSCKQCLDFLSNEFSESLPGRIRKELCSFLSSAEKDRIRKKIKLSSDYPSPEEIIFRLALLRHIELREFLFVFCHFFPNHIRNNKYSFVEKFVEEVG
ncbi:MAG: serine protease, partial [Candidatus Electrothrix sp. ATG2]|nr:serine protease [Candidatus Electrothrix sp. ATG2]